MIGKDGMVLQRRGTMAPGNNNDNNTRLASESARWVTLDINGILIRLFVGTMAVAMTVLSLE